MGVGLNKNPISWGYWFYSLWWVLIGPANVNGRLTLAALLTEQPTVPLTTNLNAYTLPF